MKLKVTHLDTFWCFLVYGLALFPLLPRGIESILMITLFLVSLILYFIEKDTLRITKKEIGTVVIFSTVFFLYIFGLMYSENLKEGMKFVIRALPIVTFPIIFGVLSKKRLHKLHLNYIFNVFVFSLLLNSIFIQGYLFLKLDISIISNWEYRQAFEELTDVHGTYYSLWLSLGGLLLLHKTIELFVQRKTIYALLCVACLSYFVYWQVVIGARLPFIMTLLLFMVLLLLKTKSKKMVFAGLFVVMSFICLIVLAKPDYLNKIKELKTYDLSLPEGDYHIKQGKITSEQIRNGIYYCSMHLAKENWLLGYGIGDVDKELQQCYKTKIKSNVYQVFQFNTHNQYLHFLLSSGIIGLAFFIMSILFPIVLVYKSENYIYALFSILIMVSLLTENVLSRHDGILFYSFFNSIFAFVSGKKLKQ